MIIEIRLSCGTNRETYPREEEARAEYGRYCAMLESHGYKIVAENREHTARMYCDAKGDYRKVSLLAE